MRSLAPDHDKAEKSVLAQHSQRHINGSLPRPSLSDRRRAYWVFRLSHGRHATSGRQDTSIRLPWLFYECFKSGLGPLHSGPRRIRREPHEMLIRERSALYRQLASAPRFAANGEPRHHGD